MEEDILNVGVRYSVQWDETERERGTLGVVREREWFERPGGRGVFGTLKYGPKHHVTL